jgi:hypothetical protein
MGQKKDTSEIPMVCMSMPQFYMNSNILSNLFILLIGVGSSVFTYSIQMVVHAVFLCSLFRTFNHMKFMCIYRPL